jgi:F-box protein 21
METPAPPWEKTCLESIPNEIITHLLYFLPPEDNLVCFQRLSKRLNRLANSGLLWRHHCVQSFKYWNPDHEFQKKLQQPVGEVDWKQLYLVRKERNTRIAQLFDGILARRVHRLHRFEQICLLGYDAKDFLLEQCAASEADVQDVLARR